VGKVSRSQRENKEHDFVDSTWHLINPQGITEIKLESLKILLHTFYHPKYKDKCL
jgi:hypothetical protein